MKLNILKDIQGQPIEILEFILNRVNYCLELSLKICCNNEIYSIFFYNVSCISIKDLSFPMQIGGFEVISNKELGYDKAVSYKVHDFEEDSISFFCEDFDLFKCDEKRI